MPLVPYPPLRGTFPSRGRLTIRGYRHLKCGEAATRALSPSYQSKESAMPYVNIKITREGHVTPEQKAALIRGVTDLLANILHKNPASTVVTIDEVPLENWGLGGDPILVAREKNQKK